MIALMIISIGAIMYSAGTYYRYEQWEEYIILVEHVKLSTIRLVQISLANYTAPGNNSTLKDNLNQWQNDLKKAYPGYGVILTYELADGTNINYYQGLASHWNETVRRNAHNRPKKRQLSRRRSNYNKRYLKLRPNLHSCLHNKM